MENRGNYQGLIRGIVKIVFIAGVIVRLVTILLGDDLFGSIRAGAMFIYGLIGSAIASMLVRRYVRISPPSPVLLGIEIVAVVAGYILFQLLAKFFFSIGLIVGIVLLLVSMLVSAYLTASTAVLLTLCGGNTFLLNNDERAELNSNLRNGYAPKEFYAGSHKMKLDTDAYYNLGIVRYSEED